jgi:hypothetical protein
VGRRAVGRYSAANNITTTIQISYVDHNKNYKALPYHASGGKFTKIQFKKRTAMGKKLIARVNRAQKSGQPLQVARFV